jgi:hypothetical protein
MGDGKPHFCPMCGTELEIMRHMAANIWEVMCSGCRCPSVVLVDDFQALPSMTLSERVGDLPKG